MHNATLLYSWQHQLRSYLANQVVQARLGPKEANHA